MKYWHEIIPERFSIIEKFSSDFLRKNFKKNGRILEIGAGLGAQIYSQNLSKTEYHVLELRQNMANELKKRFPNVMVKIGDCQEGIDYPNGFFDRVQAIHVLEHLPNLPKALNEVRRVLKKDGEFCVIIPCEGGVIHAIGRLFSGKRVFEKRYEVSYDWLIKYEHCNNANEVIEEINKQFKIVKSEYFPTRIPSIQLNLFIGLVLKPNSKLTKNI